MPVGEEWKTYRALEGISSARGPVGGDHRWGDMYPTLVRTGSEMTGLQGPLGTAACKGLALRGIRLPFRVYAEDSTRFLDEQVRKHEKDHDVVNCTVSRPHSSPTRGLLSQGRPECDRCGQTNCYSP